MEAAGTGMRLLLEGKKSLTIGATGLQFYDPAAKKAGRSSCLPGFAGLDEPLPFYNVLWAEFSDGTLTIDVAAPIDNGGAVKVEKKTFAVPKPEAYPGEPEPEAFVATLLERAYGDSKRQKRAYVLVNPNSGPGGALKKWTTEAKPIFEAARMELDIVILRKGGEAIDLVEKMDIDKYDTIIPCSGDGTPHEVINGLGKRKDAGEALRKVAVSHIPCGSGNAMSLNLYGSNKVSAAALAIVKGVVMPMDLVSVTHGDRRTLSFLSQALGIVAESDLGTENMRWMGSTRFEVGLVQRVLQRKSYPCDIAVKVDIEDKQAIKAYYKQQVRGKPLSDSEENGTEEIDDIGLPKLKYGTVQDELPEGWELIRHDKICNFYCGNMAYMSPDANFFPASLPSDGRMDLVMMPSDISPVTTTKVLLAVSSGKFYDMPHVSYRKITGYRIIPRDQEDGYISIDGERIPWEPFQAEVHQGLGRVIAKKFGYEAEGPLGWEKAGES